MRILPAVGLLALLDFGCSSETQLTRALVEVYSDFGDELESIEVAVSDPEKPGRRQSATFPANTARDPEKPNFVLSFAVAPAPNRDDGNFQVNVTGLGASGRAAVWAHARARFIPGSYVRVSIQLSKVCAGVECPDPTRTCSEELLDMDGKGRCVAIGPFDGATIGDQPPEQNTSVDAGITDSRASAPSSTEDANRSEAETRNVQSDGADGSASQTTGDDGSSPEIHDAGSGGEQDACVSLASASACMATDLDAGPSNGNAADTQQSACTRENLKAMVDHYFQAMAAHDPGMLPLASDLKFTQNGSPLQLGEGTWATAGQVKFKRTAIDTTTCGSVTESVITNDGTDAVYGVRLRLENQNIKEVEAIFVDPETGWIPRPQGLAATAADDWETVLSPDQGSNREELVGLLDEYVGLFPNGACSLAPDCQRYENGYSPGACNLAMTCSPSNATPTNTIRIHIIDVEAGIAAGLTLFAGMYTTIYMFKVRDNAVHGIHATLAPASSSGWE